MKENGSKPDQATVMHLIGLAKEELVDASRRWVAAENQTEELDVAAAEMIEKARVIDWLEGQLVSPS